MEFDSKRRGSILGDSGINPGARQQQQAIKTQQNVAEKLDKAKKEASKIFSGSLTTSAKVWGAGLGGKVGPLELNGKVEAIKGEVKAESNGDLKMTGTVLSANGKAAWGGNEAQGTIDILKLTVAAGRNGGSIDGQILDASGDVSHNAYTMDNSGAIGASGKLGQVEVAVSVNLAHATMTAVYLAQAAEEYIKGKAAEWIDSMNPLK